MWLNPRPLRHVLASAIGVIVAFWLLKTYLHLTLVQIPVATPESVERYFSALRTLAPVKSDFERFVLLGFHNNGLPKSTADCDGRRHSARLGVLPSFSLQGDLTQAMERSHDDAQIDRALQNQSLSFEDLIEENWAELPGSGVWLPEYQVYFVVTRAIYSSGSLAESPISFLRGRIFDALWNHLDNYTLDWDEDPIIFPRTFDIPLVRDENGTFVGPEDPRVILEADVPGAEPVIVFNMLSEEVDGKRAMWTHRPFTNITKALTIRGEVVKREERNWAPFFHSEPSVPRQPSHHLNFVYSMQPLCILRCHLRHGRCDWTYKQDLSEKQSEVLVRMRGSTNFIQVHESDPDISLWVGFPRTQIDGGCGSGNPIYRPELVVLANSGREFHMVYASEAIDFGTAVLDEAAREAPCTDGRLLMPNGILRWDQDRRDLLQLALNVGDRSTRVLPLRGVSQLVRSLPYLMDWRREASPDGQPWGQRWSAVGADVVGCAIGI